MAKDPLSSEIHFWRLDPAEYAASWDSGVGAEKVGGRWNPKGMATVYAALDASTAILEVAVHKDFDALDCKPHRLTQARVLDRSRIHVVQPESIANPNWLVPGTRVAASNSSALTFCASTLLCLSLPASRGIAWNMLMNPHLADGLYELVLQEPFALDGRLNKPLS